MEDNEFKHYAELMAEIIRLYREERTGSLFFISPENRMAQVNFDQGEIVFIYYRGKRGEEALQLMPEMQRARVLFEEEEDASIRIPLPTTSSIIGYLTDIKSAQQLLPVTANRSSDELQIPREIIEAELIENIGPMGGMLCAEAFAQGANIPLQDVIEQLAQFIPDQKRADIFRITLNNRLELSGSAIY